MEIFNKQVLVKARLWIQIHKTGGELAISKKAITEAHSQPIQTFKTWVFAKTVNSWKTLHTRKSISRTSAYGLLYNAKGRPLPMSWERPLPTSWGHWNMTSCGLTNVTSWRRYHIVLYVALRDVPDRRN